MIEDFFDVLMVIHDVNDEGKRQVVESFAPRICALVIDTRVNIYIQQEILKKLNAMLDKMPQDAREILSNEEMLILMRSMGDRILYIGDYDLQVGITEALCRMSTEKQRQEQACQWFSMDFVATAFKDIRNSEFETDCRKFLNLVNGMLGDKRRVYTFPCVSAFLDNYELHLPSDDKLEGFWIDFNLGTQTISFYISGDDEHQWEAVTVPEELVQLYDIEVREEKLLLSIILKNLIQISKRDGKELLFCFAESVDIIHVIQKVFGTKKYKEFTKKQSTSVAKTSVHVLFDASGSQILVPESQLSSVKEEPINVKECVKPPKYVANSHREPHKNSQSEVTTPAKRKISEASLVIPATDRYTVRSPILLTNIATPRRGRIKPPLQMMSPAKHPGVSETCETRVNDAMPLKLKPSAEQTRGNNTDKPMKTANVMENTENKENEFLNPNFNELQDPAFDSQAVIKVDEPVLPAALHSISKNKNHSNWAYWTPEKKIELVINQRENTSSKDPAKQEYAVHKKPPRQKSASSTSDDNFEETGKMQSTKALAVNNTVNQMQVEICKRSCQQQLKHSQPLKEKNTQQTKQSDWRIESETTFKSVLHNNNTVEKSLIYREKLILSKDICTTVCDKNSSRNNVQSHRKSGKKLASDLNFCDLKQKKKEKVQKKSFRQLKTTIVNVTSQCPLNDVYNFNLNGAEEPIIKLGVQELQTTTRESCVDNSIKLVDLSNKADREPSLKTKEKRVTDHGKQHLFSDSDTDFWHDDSISWLREPESKRQLIDYSRSKRAKRQNGGETGSFLKTEPPRYKKVMTPGKTTTGKLHDLVPDGRTRLPRRAAKVKINYKDLSNSDSESEAELSSKEKMPVKEETTHSKTIKRPKESQTTGAPEEPPKGWEKLSRPKDTGDSSLDVSSASLSGMPSSVEVMRGLEEITERESTHDYGCVTPQKNSSLESLNSKNDSNEKNSCTRESCSPIPHPFLPNHTPVSKNTTTGNGPGAIPQETQNSSSYSDVSSYNPQKPFVENELPNTIESYTETQTEESNSVFPLSSSSERREDDGCSTSSDTAHASSGATQHPNRKRMYIDDDGHNSDDIEMEEQEERRQNLLPPKLSRMEGVDHPTSTTSENVSALSSYEYIPQLDCKVEHSRMTYEKLRNEYKRKAQLNIFQNYCMMDYFTKQSWKSIQQHMAKVSHQVQESRNEKLDKIQFTILQELENVEREAESLTVLEKEFADFWEKLIHKLTIYQKSERQRLHVLRTSLDENICTNTEEEDAMFTSEMCVMKENMKRIQDRLLKKMQEEELRHVRRGLSSLFTSDERA
ncbi:synaptonemal complex protein 2 isoform X2 [Echinops telfairi]|uniref:Synaptonemal complex protein 2 isoform X2 n=1 Tax=Echinops telfairi TaxID=9371 RepID=A0AC55DMC5_ECHTE|nr:synaptonemal complex protein 2 isoform X2 [Echinops telfairi]